MKVIYYTADGGRRFRMYAATGVWQVKSVHPDEGYGWPVNWHPHDHWADMPHTELLPVEQVKEIVRISKSTKEAMAALHVAVRMLK
jgi:hypothetical protein